MSTPVEPIVMTPLIASELLGWVVGNKDATLSAIISTLVNEETQCRIVSTGRNKTYVFVVLEAHLIPRVSEVCEFLLQLQNSEGLCLFDEVSVDINAFFVRARESS